VQEVTYQYCERCIAQALIFQEKYRTPHHPTKEILPVELSKYVVLNVGVSIVNIKRLQSYSRNRSAATWLLSATERTHTHEIVVLIYCGIVDMWDF